MTPDPGARLPSFGWRTGCSELRKSDQTKLAFNVTDLSNSTLKSVLAKLLALNILKLVTHLIEFFTGEAFFPSRENDRILPCGVRSIHPDKGLHRRCQRLRIASGEFRPARRDKNIVNDLASSLMLRNKNVRITGYLTAGFFESREDEGLLQFLFMILLPKGTKEQSCLLKRIGRHR
jgi:hypothetical protein